MFNIKDVLIGSFINTLTANYEYSSSIVRIYHYQFKCNYLKNQKFLRHFCFIFAIYIKLWTFEKNEPPSLSIPEVIDSERRAH